MKAKLHKYLNVTNKLICKKLIAFLALAVMISSCGNKMTLMKRHYTKGYYLHHSTKTEKVSSVKVMPVHGSEMEPVKIAFPGEVKNGPFIASIKTNETVSETPKSFQAQLKSYVANTMVAKPVSAPLKQYELRAFKTFKNNNKGGTSNGNLILLVILAIFPIFSLIAMYIHDGHKVTTNFWVNLLLHLTIIGYAIFGLLVVFNVVDLA